MPPQQSIVRQGPPSAQRKRSLVAELLIWSSAVFAATATVHALDVEAEPSFADGSAFETAAPPVHGHAHGQIPHSAPNGPLGRFDHPRPRVN